MQERKLDADSVLKDLEDVGFDRQYLETQWMEQVQEQTKPLKRQSAKLADKEIFDVLALMESLKRYEEEKESYDQALQTGDYPDGLSAVELSALLEEMQKNIKKGKKAVTNKKGKLSVDGRLNLSKLIGNEFLKSRMNALALKQRLQDRLRNRKFELANLERAYRKTVNHLKLDKNASSQIKRKEPGIQNLVRKYNKLCMDLHKLIRTKKAPKGAVVPLEIEMEGLYQLDVDDDIWQDIGLNDDYDGSSIVPDWLGNEKVQVGIKSLLELERCEEEQRRLLYERLAMQEWMLEEWFILECGFQLETEADVRYQLEQRQEYLLGLCIRWEPMVQGIPCSLSSNWGPTPESLMEFQRNEFTSQLGEEDIGIYEVGEDEGFEDADFLDNVEETALLDYYRSNF